MIVIKDLYYVVMCWNLGNVNKCKNLIKSSRIRVNNQIIKDIRYQVDIDDVIVFDGIELKWPFVYYMFNKPKGYICANHDKKYKCVIDLIDRDDCYCLGRLDIDTTGLLLITNDKTLSKRLLLPENHIDKKYYVTVKNKLTDDLIEIFNNGIIIDQKVKCKPSYLEIIDDYHCYLTINEGRYHQIKKMFLSCNNKVLELKRVMFASIHLDNNLSLGNYRKLNNQEIKQLITINNTK